VATILLVDDEKILRTLVGFALRRQKHHVLEAASGRRAVTLARRHSGPIELLVAELSLPRMSGLALAGKLAAAFPAMKSLFLSRSPHSVRLEERARAEGNLVLREPFEIPELVAQVSSLLGIPAGARKPPARTSEAAGRSRQTANGEPQG